MLAVGCCRPGPQLRCSCPVTLSSPLHTNFGLGHMTCLGQSDVTCAPCTGLKSSGLLDSRGRHVMTGVCGPVSGASGQPAFSGSGQQGNLASPVGQPSSSHPHSHEMTAPQPGCWSPGLRRLWRCSHPAMGAAVWHTMGNMHVPKSVI